ncbi:DUF6412 domain-containing protein [Streptomyces cylindrosporus]|uniref:DUF6412 domain-containing protein n=1 Tax=Streptomyces cylindrosporus TaxID=2927583 RepID=A0ABS9YGW9_9ACTN|nr:DUF6412 domain-containing protein [Streptomyces cylindrosporus]MCI3276492.1 DUF6412 domain-containing protein [Streptomyces cylindrosporus]
MIRSETHARPAAVLRLPLVPLLLLLLQLALLDTGTLTATATGTLTATGILTATVALAATAAAGSALAACALVAARCAPAVPRTRIRTAIRDRARRTAFLPQRDPDARGRTRPRAPGRALPATVA